MFKDILNPNALPHALLVNENKLCNLHSFIDEYKNKLNISDLSCFIEIDGHTQSIKKEEIGRVISQFWMSSYNNSDKLYVIYGIENSSPQAINSLLKFLEEPPTNTYAVLTTRNNNNVLPTIKSRCQSITLQTSLIEMQELIEKYNLDDQQVNVIKANYFGVNDLSSDLQNGIFLNLYSIAKQLKFENKNLKVIKNISDQFKKMSYSEILMVLKFINCLGTPNVNLLDLIEAIKFTPSKMMIFNKLWNILENK